MRPSNHLHVLARSSASAGALLALLMCLPSTSFAKPDAPSLICEANPDAAMCRGHVLECSTCHTSTDPVAWNAYGLSLIPKLDLELPYKQSLLNAFAATATEDADADGVSNRDEIYMGTSPGDAGDYTCASKAAPSVPDLQLAHQKVHILFCGRSPSYEQTNSFDGSAERLHQVLDECLRSEFWRDVALPRLGDTKIRPIYVYGPYSRASVALANYDWDYRLFTYVLLNDRDARDLLLARYHVKRDEGGELVRIEGIVAGDIPPQRFGFPGGQPLEPEYRAGMLTTQWFLAYNTFLSALPRGSASQAYRAFLSMDIAKLQGITPVINEPLDLDERDVDAPACAQCHSTLDPLAYAFTFYEGVPTSSFLPPGSYNPNRPERLLEGWNNPQSWLLGERVASVREWAEVAAQSDAFSRMLGRTFFKYIFDREPIAAELTEFDACWQALPSYSWSANKLIHCLVELSFFAPGGTR